MAYQITLPTALSTEPYVTMLISQTSSLPTIVGQWERNGAGQVIAWYTRAQLREAVLAGLAIRAGDLEARLEHGEQLLLEAQQRGDEQDAAQIQRQWVTLLAQLTHTLSAQRAISAR